MDQYHQRNQRDKKEMEREYTNSSTGADAGGSRGGRGGRGDMRLSLEDAALLDLPGTLFNYLKSRGLYMEACTVYEDYAMKNRIGPGSPPSSEGVRYTSMDTSELYGYECTVEEVTGQQLAQHRQRIESTYMPLPLRTCPGFILPHPSVSVTAVVMIGVLTEPSLSSLSNHILTTLPPFSLPHYPHYNIISHGTPIFSHDANLPCDDNLHIP